MQYAFLSLLFACIVIALARGGRPEKWGAAALVAMTVVQVVGNGLVGARFGAIDWVACGVDLIGFGAFTAIALFARRVWPLWASALQLFSLATHFVRSIDIGIHPAVYWLMKSAPTMGISLILIAATLLHRRRLKLNGADQSWMAWRGGRGEPPSMRTIRRF